MANTIAFSTTTSPTTPAGPRKLIAPAVAVNSSQASCDILDIRGISFLAVKPPTSVTSLTFYAGTSPSDTFVLINDLGTLGVVTVTASVWQTIDFTKLAPHHYIQMVSAGANGNVACVAMA